MKVFLHLVCTIAIFTLLLSGCQPAARSPGSVLFQDDFSSPDSGWPQGEDVAGLTQYAYDGYRIYIQAIGIGKIAVPHKDFQDVRLEVDATKIAGPDDNTFGLICRYQNEKNFYFFELSSDGYAGIGKMKEGNLSLFNAGKMEPTDAIRQGVKLNRLKAECTASSLTFYINGIKVHTVEDQEFPRGDVGLMAGTLSKPGTDLYFDNFKVIQP